MATYFIADLHLDSSQPHITQLFINFIENHIHDADKLYILGDLFEMWVGDDDLSSFNQYIINTLKQLSTRMAIYFLPGNRDILLGLSFAKAAGMTLITEPTIINLYGKRTLLLHGDSLCTQDKSHQRFRKLSHNPKIQRFFFSLPLAWRKKIIENLRSKSTKKTKLLHPEIMDVNFAEIPSLLKSHHAQQLIHGHTHRPGIYWRLDPNNNFLKTYTLSDWHSKANALRCDENLMKLVYF